MNHEFAKTGVNCDNLSGQAVSLRRHNGGTGPLRQAIPRHAPTPGRTVSGSSKRQAGSSHNRRLRRSPTSPLPRGSPLDAVSALPRARGPHRRPRRASAQRGPAREGRALPARAPWTRAACSAGGDPGLRRGRPPRSSGAARSRSAEGRERAAGPLRAGHRRFASAPSRGTGAAPGAPRGTAGRRPGADSDGLTELRRRLTDYPGIEVVPLWLRGRATGVMLTLGRPQNSLAEIARQAAAATTLADRYTDAFARGTRRKQPTPGAEIQQSLLPPRISRVTGGEVAGNVVPSYEVAGDWFDVVENSDGGLGHSRKRLGQRDARSRQQRRGAWCARASRRGGGAIRDALMLMHRTLREMPGPRAEMSAVAAHWDLASHRLSVANCGNVPPIVIRADQEPQRLRAPKGVDSVDAPVRRLPSRRSPSSQAIASSWSAMAWWEVKRAKPDWVLTA